MVGIVKSKEVFGDIAELAADGIKIVKGGKLSGVFKLFELLDDIRELIMDAPLALPELMDLDKDESAELAAAAYEMVKKIIMAVKQ